MLPGFGQLDSGGCRENSFWDPAHGRLPQQVKRGLSPLGVAQKSYMPIDDPRQLYHNIVVVLASEGGKGLANGSRCVDRSLDLRLLWSRMLEAVCAY